MKVKSAHRNNSPAQTIAERIAEEIPASEKISLDGEPAADAVAVHRESDAPPNAAVAEALAKASTADEATARLQRQLHELQRAEQFQRQAALQNRPLTHNEKLASWKAAGMSDGDHDFLASNPDMVLHDRLTAVAAHQAAQEGHARDSDAHRKRTRQLFNEHFETTDDVKATKKEAHYRPGTTHRHCELCSMFLFPHHDTKNGDGECSLVEGTISPSALCDHYERKKERAAGGAADQDEDDSGKVHYERVKGVASPGSFRLPHHAIHKLGGGDGRTAGKVLKHLFDVDPDNPTVVPVETVHRIGNGNIGAGHRVLHRFVQKLRRGGARSQTVEQPDGHRGRVR